jgi:hypothetical protein
MGDMTDTATLRAPLRTGSHFITIGHDGIEKEEVWIYFETSWRNRPAIVEMSADRYVHSSGMSEWRITARDAKESDPTRNGNRGDDLTQLARQRLGAQLRPVVEQWLASERYTESRQAAFGHALYRMALDLSARFNSTDPLRKALAMYGHELKPETMRRLFDAADAYDRFSAIVRGED